MTAQINDVFTYKNTTFSVSGISEGRLFDPATLDLKPAMTTTACWRGYQVGYAIYDNRLVVADLYVNLIQEGSENYTRQIGPEINGVSPAGPGGGFAFFNNLYKGINYHMEYSGGLLLADGFLQELYVHMGFHPAWKYESVLELIFENGVFQEEFDRSEQMAEIRAMVMNSESSASDDEPSEKEIRQFVDRAFDRTYRM